MHDTSAACRVPPCAVSFARGFTCIYNEGEQIRYFFFYVTHIYLYIYIYLCIYRFLYIYVCMYVYIRI